ncbi:MAG: hypothetical protein JW941_05415, partial [Candidatus Coatesbacteria bacterium]|nr:hypothetical protein [Candidatus Coatesbacteria bacterium]
VLILAFAVAMQVSNLPSMLRSRAESELKSGDYTDAMAKYIKVRRIERDSAPSEAKMREIALTGIEDLYKRSRDDFAQGQIDRAFNEWKDLKKLEDDYYFVFPSQHILAGKDDKLLSVLDNIKDNSCYMGKVHSLLSEWVRAKARLSDCMKSGSESEPLFWQVYVDSVNSDWRDAAQALKSLMEVSGIGSRIGEFEKSSRGTKVGKTNVKSLIPAELHSSWSVVELMHWSDLSRLFEIYGMQLVFPGGEKIGQTGVSAPCDISVRSAGEFHGNFGSILVNGVDVSANLRGYNLVAIDPKTKEVIASGRFDAIARKNDELRLARMIARFPAGTVVVLAAKGKTKVSPDLFNSFESIGGEFAMVEPDRYLWSHCVIGVKGASAGTALEMQGRGSSSLEVCGPRDFGTDEAEVRANIKKRASEENRAVVYMSGKGLDSDVYLASP